jgi:hypothetical protein
MQGGEAAKAADSKALPTRSLTMGEGIHKAFSFSMILFVEISRSFIEHSEQIGLFRSDVLFLRLIHVTPHMPGFASVAANLNTNKKAG